MHEPSVFSILRLLSHVKGGPQMSAKAANEPKYRVLEGLPACNGTAAFAFIWVTFFLLA
jgi:hypothetical protein